METHSSLIEIVLASNEGYVGDEELGKKELVLRGFFVVYFWGCLLLPSLFPPKQCPPSNMLTTTHTKW